MKQKQIIFDDLYIDVIQHSYFKAKDTISDNLHKQLKKFMYENIASRIIILINLELFD